MVSRRGYETVIAAGGRLLGHCGVISFGYGGWFLGSLRRRRGPTLSSRSQVCSGASSDWRRVLRQMYAVGDGALSQLWPTFTSDTFFTAPILALSSLGECLSLVLSRVSTLGLSPMTPETGTHSLDIALWFSKASEGEAVLGMSFPPRLLGGSSERLLELGLGSGVVWRYIHTGFEKVISLWSSSGTSYSGDVKGNPGIRGNEENLTFPRVTLKIENGNRYQRISKSKLAERAGFSGWAKLDL
ncbi:hypothetical protein YC2023_094730 [Brassica napus]